MNWLSQDSEVVNSNSINTTHETSVIDRVCINQEDPVEWKEQVLLMGEICKCAYDVLVSLGDPPPGLLNAAGYPNQIPGVVKKIERNVVRIGPNFLSSMSAGLPINDNPVWAIMIKRRSKD
ncbi:hypothetical protein NA56DRAFT_712849 [Hyaloscypha hepaticicola]|uniref:Heterokaryon incompatibility domain-containing protein n=1 Tax=Hyaloscypha hepaticicola TaxID=2082293 RepID=A0A2J6PFC2_9HELO|nr:hypothetical protein NA56DRAFT_712849 [Hyaloscypha hepaticicola]